MTHHDNIKQAFWTIIETQAQNRSRPLTQFNREVAQTILNGGLLAYQDRLEAKAQYRVISAPTGSGKSSYAWALIAALTQAAPGSSALFLCETIDQCGDTYKELAKLVDPSDLAIWTSAHDRAKPIEDIRREYAFTPSARFFAKDLSSHRVAIVTHAFYKGSRGDLARHYEGLPRTLTVVDERPKEVSLFEIDQGDVAKALDWAVVTFGNDTPAEKALKALRDYLIDTWETERPKGKNFKPLKRSDLSWFSSEEASAGGYAALILIAGEEQIIVGRDPATTNNKMEMTAAIRALEALPPGTHATIHSDSQYVVKGIGEWLPGWKKRGWRTAAGEPVKNQPLWEALDRLNAGRRITWKWVKGHAGHEQNERVDGLANGEAQKVAEALRQI